MNATKYLTTQEAFDIAAQHLLMQGRRATLDKGLEYNENSDCAYRAPNGAKCAIGCLITDEQYDPCMENLKAYEVISRFNLIHLKHVPNYFLQGLQRVHDEGVPTEWRASLKDLGDQYKLNTGVVGAI